MLSRHQYVIAGGLGCITLALGILMAVDNSHAPTASLGQLIAQGTPSASPNSSRAGSGSVVKKKIGDTLVTPSMSPILSPKIGDTSPMSPTVSPILSVSPTPSLKEYKQISPTPVAKSPMPSQTASPTVTPSSVLTPSPSPVTSTPTPNVSPSTTPAHVVPIIFSEIGWMGTQASSTDEWIELYNPNSIAVSLEGWILKSESDGSPTISLTGTIDAQSVYILERTGDENLKEISANWKGSFGSGGLKNEGERLVLLDAHGVLQDSVGGGAWYAGDSVTKASMERIHSGTPGESAQNWRSVSQPSTVHDAAGNAVIGTPGIFSETP